MRIAYFVSNRTVFPGTHDQITASSSVVHNIISVLKKRHDITVFAPKGSHMDGVRIANLGSDPFHLDSDIVQDEWVTKYTIGKKLWFIGEILKQAHMFDLIHIHTEPIYLGMAFVNLIKTSVLFTSHNAVHDYEVDLYMSHLRNNINFSALSYAQIGKLSNSTIPVIPNGIEYTDIPFYSGKDAHGYLFLGRLVEDKGIDTLIHLIESDLQRKYSIVGKGSAQWEKIIVMAAEKNSQITFHSILPRLSTEWSHTIGKSKALLMPIRYEDTCPLVPLEAMAHGTPVIAFARGALPEQIEDGKTGFLINPSNTDMRGNYFMKETGISGLKSAISHIEQMPLPKYMELRRQCRVRIEKLFSVERMAASYETLYNTILANR